MSLFTTISGIANNQAMLDVIGDNIANINTIGFKSSKINFETVFSNTLSSGAVPTSNSGGINPKQIGLGVTISEISRNFTRGPLQSTGRLTDLNIKGEGFFSLQDSDGSMVFSRAGNFSVDPFGNLVNPGGLKVLGTSSVTSSEGGEVTVQIPPFLVLEETNTVSAGGVPGTPVTEGTFDVEIDDGSPVTVSIDVTNADTIQDIVNKLNTAFDNENSSSTATLEESTNQIVITAGSSEVITFTDGTGNFASVSGLNSSATSVSLTDTPEIAISAGDSNNDNNCGVSSYAISDDGAVEITYSNGGRLTVTTSDSGESRELKYINSKSQAITGVTTAAVDPAQLQIQLAQVINPNGLMAIGGNLFSVTEVAGSPTFAIGREGGLGSIDSGSVEASNVDLPTEFANMILSQKAVEANSRAFSIQNRILDVIVNLGR